MHSPFLTASEISFIRAVDLRSFGISNPAVKVYARTNTLAFEYFTVDGKLQGKEVDVKFYKEDKK